VRHGPGQGKAGLKNADLRSLISKAKAEAETETKITQQQEFVAWWKETVSPGHGGDRSKSRVPGTCSVAEAEKRTKILKQQVSRWKTGLARPDYRARLVNPSYRKGLAEAALSAACIGA
jgi:hypothetical protein